MIELLRIYDQLLEPRNALSDVKNWRKPREKLGRLFLVWHVIDRGKRLRSAHQRAAALATGSARSLQTEIVERLNLFLDSIPSVPPMPVTMFGVGVAGIAVAYSVANELPIYPDIGHILWSTYVSALSGPSETARTLQDIQQSPPAVLLGVTILSLFGASLSFIPVRRGYEAFLQTRPITSSHEMRAFAQVGIQVPAEFPIDLAIRALWWTFVLLLSVWIVGIAGLFEINSHASVGGFLILAVPPLVLARTVYAIDRGQSRLARFLRLTLLASLPLAYISIIEATAPGWGIPALALAAVVPVAIWFIPAAELRHIVAQWRRRASVMLAADGPVRPRERFRPSPLKRWALFILCLLLAEMHFAAYRLYLKCCSNEAIPYLSGGPSTNQTIGELHVDIGVGFLIVAGALAFALATRRVSFWPVRSAMSVVAASIVLNALATPWGQQAETWPYW